MAQQSRQSLMAVAMRLYGSFAGKSLGVVTAALVNLEDIEVRVPNLGSVVIASPNLDSLTISAPRLDSVQVQQ